MEYAIEAINNAGTCVGIMGKEGIVLAGELLHQSKYWLVMKLLWQKQSIAHARCSSISCS